MEKSTLSKQSVCFIITAVTVCVGMFILNCLTPLIADDFTHAHIWGTNEKITNFAELFSSTKAYYTDWGGRFNFTFLAQMFSSDDKIIFNVFNSFIYLVFVLAVYYHINGRAKTNAPLFINVNAAVWLLAPVFGQTVLWLTGACMYMWVVTFALVFLLPYRFFIEKPFKSGFYLKYVMFILGLICGCGFENTSAAMLAMCVSFIWLFHIKHKIAYGNIPVWCYSGLSGGIIGFLIMILSPGTQKRLIGVTMAADRNAFLQALKNILYSSVISAVFLFVLLMSALYFIYRLLRKKENRNFNTLLDTYAVYLFGAFAAVYSMSLSPYFPPRATFNAFAFLLAGVFLLAKKLQWGVSFAGIKKRLAAGILYTVFALSVFLGAKDVYSYSNDITYETAFRLTDAELHAALYQPKPQSKPIPDWNAIHEELARHKNLNLQFMWEEYRVGQPEGLSYSQFCKLYRQYRKATDRQVSLYNERKAGELMESDWLFSLPPRKS